MTRESENPTEHADHLDPFQPTEPFSRERGLAIAVEGSFSSETDPLTLSETPVTMHDMGMVREDRRLEKDLRTYSPSDWPMEERKESSMTPSQSSSLVTNSCPSGKSTMDDMIVIDLADEVTSQEDTWSNPNPNERRDEHVDKGKELNSVDQVILEASNARSIEAHEDMHVDQIERPRVASSSFMSMEVADGSRLLPTTPRTTSSAVFDELGPSSSSKESYPSRLEVSEALNPIGQWDTRDWQRFLELFYQLHDLPNLIPGPDPKRPQGGGHLRAMQCASSLSLINSLCCHLIDKMERTEGKSRSLNYRHYLSLLKMTRMITIISNAVMERPEGSEIPQVSSEQSKMIKEGFHTSCRSQKVCKVLSLAYEIWESIPTSLQPYKPPSEIQGRVQALHETLVCLSKRILSQFTTMMKARKKILARRGLKPISERILDGAKLPAKSIAPKALRKKKKEGVKELKEKGRKIKGRHSIMIIDEGEDMQEDIMEKDKVNEEKSARKEGTPGQRMMEITERIEAESDSGKETEVTRDDAPRRGRFLANVRKTVEIGKRDQEKVSGIQETRRDSVTQEEEETNALMDTCTGKKSEKIKKPSEVDKGKKKKKEEEEKEVQEKGEKVKMKQTRPGGKGERSALGRKKKKKAKRFKKVKVKGTQGRGKEDKTSGTGSEEEGDERQSMSSKPMARTIRTSCHLPEGVTVSKTTMKVPIPCRHRRSTSHQDVRMEERVVFHNE